MEFHRLGYPLFLLGAWLLGSVARGNRNARNIILLIASLAFYAYADPKFVALLAGVAVLAYFGAPLVAPGAARTRRGLALAALIAAELSGLAFFKYYDFLAVSLNGVLDAIGKAEMLPVLHLAAVAGVSFYSFQAVGYLIDVYRGETEPERDFIAFALFICFFPQLLAGPIGRAGALLPQWKSDPRPDDREMSNGLFLMISGACKKVLIGDFLGTRIVNPAFTHPTGIGWIGALLGIYGFAFQLYGDFAGYSEMAVGSAKCFGIKLTNNFNAPYRSRNVTEFWNRWHISLSTWIRDYVFLPISGRAPSKLRSHGAAIASMTLCGLWHGASFAWIGWGFLHGIGLAIHQIFLSILRKRFALKKKLDKSVPFRIAATLLTFHFCCIGLFLVRAGDPSLQGAKSAGDAWARLRVMAAELLRSPRGEGVFFVNFIILAAFALAIASHAVPGNIKLRIARHWDAIPRIAQGAILAAVVLLLFVVRPDMSPFIYTNF
ncbi:MAG: MBOAT family protein [Planctomycetes bacterium]|nr:MBOAT family protein [Planctomycetota bacterium]